MIECEEINMVNKCQNEEEIQFDQEEKLVKIIQTVEEIKQGDIEWKFSDLRHPSNLIAMGSGFCFVDQCGVFRYDVKNRKLLKIASVPKSGFPDDEGIIHFFESSLYVLFPCSLRIFDFLNNTWTMFENCLRVYLPLLRHCNFSYNRWVEIEENLYFYLDYPTTVWHWDRKNELFQEIEENIKLRKAVVRQVPLGHCFRCHYDAYVFHNLRFSLNEDRTGLKIQSLQSFGSICVNIQSYKLKVKAEYRMIVQFQENNLFGFFLVQGYVRKERECGLKGFPTVMLKQIQKCMSYYVVHLIETGKYLVMKRCNIGLRHISIDLSDVNINRVFFC